MVLPTRFAAASSATGQQLDNDFDAVGALTTIQCTASGTNSITLAPLANAPTINSYGAGNPFKFGFTAVGNSTSAVTLRIGNLSFLPLYLPTNVQAGSGAVSNGFYYEITFVQSLNSGVGGWVMTNAQPGNASFVTLARVQGLKITNNGPNPNIKANMTALNAILITPGGTPILVSNLSVVIDLTTVGANGMDSGSRPASGWVYLYFISNGTTLAGLASATSPSSGNPTLPGGYSYFAYVGAMFCDGSQNLKKSLQLGKRAQYVVTPASNTAALPAIDSGAKGTYSATSPSYATASISFVVPLTAGEIAIVADGGYNNATTSAVQLAPNSNYSGYRDGSGNAPLFDTTATLNVGAVETWMTLESTTVSWASSAAGGAILCAGWSDYYSAAA